MFVASHVESGSEMAAAGLLPQIIGHVEKAIGSGTRSSGSGSAVEIVIGEPVCQGDVIETACDGRISIRFIDGTLFHLSGSTRAVLNEFVCDADGVTQSALFEVSTGTFAFIPGHLARSGCLRVDTPVGTIRGRAQAGGIGMVSLIALSFAVLHEARAADPDLTFLDDGNITYKQLEHGSFELVTKEAVPRHILVEDPGQTIVLRAQGSSVSVSQVLNSTSRMGELQEAQQDVLANFTKGFGPPTGSSTPPSGDTLPLQPINFIQNENAPAKQEALPPLPSAVIAVYETIVASPPPPAPPAPPAPPTLHAVAGPTEVDTVAFDEFSATSGTFAASSSSGAPLTFGISGADPSSGSAPSDAAPLEATLAASTLDESTFAVSTLEAPPPDVSTPDLTGFDVSKKGSYGTLYLNSTTGAYIFVPDSAAINALTAPTTESFVITVSDGTLTASQLFTITINGTNDAASISGVTTGFMIEPDGYDLRTVTGTLNATDVDNPPDIFTAVNTPTASDAGYGTFTMTADGTWSYTLNTSNEAVQALNVGGTLTDTFTVTSEDGTPQLVTITIEGTNDAAVISGTTTGSVNEPEGCGTPTASGILTATDVDDPSSSFTAVCSPEESDAGYGTFTMTADGVWTYMLDGDNRAVQALNVGCSLTDAFTVTTEDGTEQVVTITIEGTNDAAIICGKTTGLVIEAGDHECGKPTASGKLTADDVDNAANSFTAVNTPTASDSGYGTFTMTADGKWTYTLDDDNCAVQALNDGCRLTDTFTVTTEYGTPQVVTITIVGSDDDHHYHRDNFDWLATGSNENSEPENGSKMLESDAFAEGSDHAQAIEASAVDPGVLDHAGGVVHVIAASNDLLV